MMTDDYHFMFPNSTTRVRGVLCGKDEYRATSRGWWHDRGMTLWVPHARGDELIRPYVPGQ